MWVDTSEPGVVTVMTPAKVASAGQSASIAILAVPVSVEPGTVLGLGAQSRVAVIGDANAAGRAVRASAARTERSATVWVVRLFPFIGFLADLVGL